MTILLCPVCKNHLSEAEKYYYCPQKHSFDKSRYGYVNLLLANMKHTKEPGDNKEMVKCRARFLNQGHYKPISDLLNLQIKQSIRQESNQQLADIGCGNGYYLRQLTHYLEQHTVNYWGMDISREAILLAAKETKNIHWLVSNIAELPFASESLHSMISVFSPQNMSEFHRVINQEGNLFVIYPGENHLYELREMLFSEIKTILPERILTTSADYFSVVEKIPLTYSINLTTNQDIVDLFGMTPYYWRCTLEKRQTVLSLNTLTLTIDVILWIFKKNGT